MKWPQSASVVGFNHRNFVVAKAPALEDISDAVVDEMFGGVDLSGLTLDDIEDGLVDYDQLVMSGGTDVFGDPIDEEYGKFFQALGTGLKAVGTGIAKGAKGVAKGVKVAAVGPQGRGGIAGAARVAAVGPQGKGGIAGATKFALTGKEWGDKKGGLGGAAIGTGKGAKYVLTGKEWGDDKGGLGGAARGVGRGVKKFAEGSSDRRERRQDRREDRRERRQDGRSDRGSDLPMIASYREQKRQAQRRRDLMATDESLLSKARALRSYRTADRSEPGVESIQSAPARMTVEVARPGFHPDTPANVRGLLFEIKAKIARGDVAGASQVAEDLMNAINLHGKSQTGWGQDVFAKLWPLIRA